MSPTNDTNKASQTLSVFGIMVFIQGLVEYLLKIKKTANVAFTCSRRVWMPLRLRVIYGPGIW